jgi:hypothetical protein
MLPIREKKNQPTWVEHGLPDLRSLERELRSAAIEEIDAATDHEAAIEMVAHHLGFIDPAVISIDVVTPLGLVTIHRGSIYHIVEKRSDARERYVKIALGTLSGPLEVWKVAYDDDSYRLAYIGAYETKRQMLVVVSIKDGLMLWNFMQTDAKSLNKHRHGVLLHSRYEAF